MDDHEDKVDICCCSSELAAFLESQFELLIHACPDKNRLKLSGLGDEAL